MYILRVQILENKKKKKKEFDKFRKNFRFVRTSNELQFTNN